MSEKDKIALQKFYENNNIKFKGLTTYQQVILFKRTVNFIFIEAHFFDKKPNAKFVNPGIGKDKGFGLVRTQAYIFYKDGSILYELDHDHQEYNDTHFTQVSDKKLLKRNYELNDKLNNKELVKCGESGKSVGLFNKAAHELLRQDKESKSIDFITN